MCLTGHPRPRYTILIMVYKILYILFVRGTKIRSCRNWWWKHICLNSDRWLYFQWHAFVSTVWENFNARPNTDGCKKLSNAFVRYFTGKIESLRVFLNARYGACLSRAPPPHCGGIRYKCYRRIIAKRVAINNYFGTHRDGLLFPVSTSTRCPRWFPSLVR